MEDPSSCLFSSLLVDGIRLRGEPEMLGQVRTLFSFQSNFFETDSLTPTFSYSYYSINGINLINTNCSFMSFFEVLNIWIILNGPERFF